MPKRKEIRIHEDTIEIIQEGWTQLAFATYREDYFDELTNLSWHLSKGYLYNSKLRISLHRYMMQKWYGSDLLKEMTEKGYIVDHMNNNHMDCRICNLEFLKHNRNVAKGQQFDKESKRIRNRIAVSLFKDFATGCYQITIGFNELVTTTDVHDQVHYVKSAKLLYNCDYSIVVLDAETIICEYETTNTITLTSLHCCEYRVNEAETLNVNNEEASQAFIVRDGVPYFVIGNGKAFLVSTPYDKGWNPPNK